MTGCVTTGAGRVFQLPVPLEWEMDYTAGVPCDSFRLRCPWEETGGTDPGDWVGFSAVEDGETVFTGVVDECEAAWDSQGAWLELSGRGMAALLLDNEAPGQDYGTATLADILRDHVTPFGIRVAEQKALPPVSQFSVATGSSEWSVLYEFARYHGGVTPRFDRKGRLILSGWTESENLLINGAAPVTGAVMKHRRYGVLSEIWVRDRTRQAAERVENAKFKQNGGRCRRVMTMPGRSNFKAMRYSGQFQLDKSAANLKHMEITVAAPFYGKPGDLAAVRLQNWAGNGNWRVVATKVVCDGQGTRTILELAEPDVVL